MIKKFRVNKFYFIPKAGIAMHIVGRARSTLQGRCLIAEVYQPPNAPFYRVIAKKKDAGKNWEEMSYAEFLDFQTATITAFKEAQQEAEKEKIVNDDCQRTVIARQDDKKIGMRILKLDCGHVIKMALDEKCPDTKARIYCNTCVEQNAQIRRGSLKMKNGGAKSESHPSVEQPSTSPKKEGE